jgi:hypothetical protein
MKIYTFQDCTSHELEFGLSGYMIELYANDYESALCDAKKLAREGSTVSFVEVSE